MKKRKLPLDIRLIMAIDKRLMFISALIAGIPRMITIARSDSKERFEGVYDFGKEDNKRV